ncbi:MAG: DEAD/DEAH box helicase family protein, partial [Candidatus Woesearchaeota archaeon]
MSEQDAQFNLRPDEELKLHQLRIKEYWFNKQNDISTLFQNLSLESDHKNIPEDERWVLTKDINLYDWQKECIEKWFQNKKGTIKVVTGAGKTILALAIIEKLRNEVCKDLYVVIVVPTIVLMNQWYDEIIKRGNLPADLIGRLGGGFKEDFSSNKRILITVLATAYKELPSIVDKCKISDKL